MSLTYKGRPFSADAFGRDLIKAATESVKSQLHEKFSSVRDPETGEFPTVRVFGDTLEDVRVSIEGSPSLLETVSKELPDDEKGAVELSSIDQAETPRAFLSYSFDDRDLAEALAKRLRARGVDVWWAEWEIGPGDSLRRKIDEGLGGCSHFLVLLTPDALKKPWINEEMDAGLVRRISGQAKFIALRKDLPVKDLPPLLQGALSPEIGDDVDASARDLANAIHGVSRKPALGPKPTVADQPKTRSSSLATAIAGIFVKETAHADFNDPQKGIEELAEALEASVADVEDAIYELRDFLTTSLGRVLPKPGLFAEFDTFFMDHDPAKDALRLAADIVNDETMPRNTAEVAARYGWNRRRMNPALAWLLDRRLIRDSRALNSDSWLTVWIDGTDATRRFVKSRS